MTATPTATFDTEALRRAEEGADAEGLLALIADDAVIESIDSEHPPSSPLVLRGKDEIGTFLRDVASRPRSAGRRGRLHRQLRVPGRHARAVHGQRPDRRRQDRPSDKPPGLGLVNLGVDASGTSGVYWVESANAGPL